MKVFSAGIMAERLA